MKDRRLYLSLGTNLGDRLDNLERAIVQLVQELGDLCQLSAVYESEAWGYQSSHAFYNCCLALDTDLSPLESLDRLEAIERGMGRTVKADSPHGADTIPAAYQDRIIDLDLLFYGKREIDHPRLKLPHPAIEKRRFVLLPLSEIAPRMIHLPSQQTISQLLERCEDGSRVFAARESWSAEIRKLL